MPWLRRFLPAVVLLASCRSVTTPFEYPDDLHNPNYVKRTMAVRQFAARKDRSQLPDAFRLLMDQEAHIRTVAHATIRDMMPDGEDFGYRPYLDEGVRAGIVARWRAWWIENRESAAPTGDERG